MQERNGVAVFGFFNEKSAPFEQRHMLLFSVLVRIAMYERLVKEKAVTR